MFQDWSELACQHCADSLSVNPVENLLLCSHIGSSGFSADLILGGWPERVRRLATVSGIKSDLHRSTLLLSHMHWTRSNFRRFYRGAECERVSCWSFSCQSPSKNCGESPSELMCECSRITFAFTPTAPARKSRGSPEFSACLKAAI